MPKSATKRVKNGDVPASNFDYLDDELYERPGHLIRRIYQIITGLFFEETAEIGLTQLQYLVLRSVARHPNVSQRRLADYLALDRTTIGWIIVGLEKKGLLRIKVSTSDRRKKDIEVLKSGLDAIKLIEPMVARLQSRILAPVPTSQRAPFLAGLKAIAEAYNEYSRAPLRKEEARKVLPGSTSRYRGSKLQ